MPVRVRERKHKKDRKTGCRVRSGNCRDYGGERSSSDEDGMEGEQFFQRCLIECEGKKS